VRNMGVRRAFVYRHAKHLAWLVVALSLLSSPSHAETSSRLSTANAASDTDRAAEPAVTTADQAGYECSVDAETAPSSATQWLERGLWASHCYAFQARAVAIDNVGVRTLALSHRIHEGVRQQVVQYLDGPSVSIERRSPVGRLAWTEENSNGEQSSPARWAAHLERYYAIELEDDARVAGRDAVKLIFEPHDQWRFSHEWWLDRDTGLLLKHVLIDQQRRIIETFQITQLQSPQKYTGVVNVEGPRVVLNTPWQVTWLPEGFRHSAS